MKRSKIYIRFICKFVLLVIGCSLLINCSNEKPLEQTVIVVKVPPFYNEKISDEENFRRFDNFLFPQNKIANPPPKGIPNYDAILDVSLNANGSIELNTMKQGDVSDTKQLEETLERLFNEREESGVYEPGNWKVVKAVGIRAENSVEYRDLFKVVEAIKKSGADPIVLRFEDDAGNFENYFKK